MAETTTSSNEQLNGGVPVKMAYSVAELSQMGLGTEQVIRLRIRQREMPAIRDGSHWLVLHDDLMDYIERRKKETAEYLATLGKGADRS